MAIIIDNAQDCKKYTKKTHSDQTQKLTKYEIKIADKIFIGINNARDKATEIADANEEKYSGKYKYPFKYVPEKDEYCFLISKIYLAGRVINDTLKDIFITNCEEFQKHNFSYENQLLIFEDLKNVPEHKYDKIIHSHDILNNGEEYEMSEINDALLCIRGISDEC